MENKEKYTAGFCYEIYIGIKDKDSYLENITVEDFCKTLTEICAQKDIAFSLITQLGGYQHDWGYTTETSLRIVIIVAGDHRAWCAHEKNCEHRYYYDNAL